MRRLLPILLVIVAVGCADRERVPVMGHWTGSFENDQGQALKGYLQLYRTDDMFKMHLASKDQAMDFEGTWTIAKRRVVLTVADIKFDNPSEEEQKALGLHILAPDSVRAAYGKPVALDLDASGTKLTGLTMKVDFLSGHHEFEKAEAARNSQKVIDEMRHDN